MIIDILFLMIFLIMGVFGMRKGFIESLTDFLNLVVGISIALFFYVDLSFFISKYVSINQTIIIFFSIGVIFHAASYIFSIGLIPRRVNPLESMIFAELRQKIMESIFSFDSVKT